MTLSRTETIKLFDLVLSQPAHKAREELHVELLEIRRTEAEFNAGVLKYHQSFTHTSKQWFDFLSKIRDRVFRDEIRIMNKLSPDQRESLPPPTFER